MHVQTNMTGLFWYWKKKSSKFCSYEEHLCFWFRSGFKFICSDNILGMCKSRWSFRYVCVEIVQIGCSGCRWLGCGLRVSSLCCSSSSYRVDKQAKSAGWTTITNFLLEHWHDSLFHLAEYLCPIFSINFPPTTLPCTPGEATLQFNWFPHQLFPAKIKIKKSNWKVISKAI